MGKHYLSDVLETFGSIWPVRYPIVFSYSLKTGDNIDGPKCPEGEYENMSTP